MRSNEYESTFTWSSIMKTFKLLAVTAAFGIAGVAGATTSSELPSVRVRYDDLNLNAPAGIAKLHARIHGAARFVCTPLESRVLGLREAYDRCVVDAVTEAVNAVGNANLSDFHRHGAKAVMVAQN